MKIHRPLTYLLIIGILGSTKAQPRTLDKAQFPGLGKIPGSDIRVILEQIGDKCNENGGPTAFEHFKNGPKYFRDCVSSVVDVTMLGQGMDDAKAQGKLDIVFKELCDRVPTVTKCMRNLTDTFALCVKPEEKGKFEIVNKITDSLLESICHNRGNRIAMFIAAGGVDCVKYKQPEIAACGDETFGKYFQDVQSVGADFFHFPSPVISRKDCTDLEEFRACVVPVLETCPDPTPGNVLDSLFNVVRRATPCEELINRPPPPTKTDVPANLDQEQGAMETETAIGKKELQEKSLVKQIEAAEAQVRAANAQERAALAQEKTAKVMEQVGKTWLSRNSNHRYLVMW